MCECSGGAKNPHLTVRIPLRFIIILTEVGCFLFYGNQFIRLKVKVKYGIKCEIVSAAGLWIMMRIIIFVLQVAEDCQSKDNLTHYISESFVLLLFIDLIVIPLVLLKRYSSQSQPQSQPPPSTLIYSFPEALYLWTPNHYFNLFLQQHYPHLVNYRPLMADILRYDFQIEEALLNSISKKESIC